MKTCQKCNKLKPFSGFNTHAKQKDGFQPWCKSCMKKHMKKYYQKNREKLLDYNRERSYGITSEQFRQKIADQNNACEICCTPFVVNKNPHVDHNHITNAIRGLLCNNCNLLLGHSKESPDILQSAQSYLKRYSQQ
jgi:hypothetical protein